MAKNYYVTLGISRGADLKQIKEAYRRVAKKYHPDTTQSNDTRRFREIKEAYETLVDEDTRQEYDAALQNSPTPMRISSLSSEIMRRNASLQTMKPLVSFMDEVFEGFVPGFFHKERYRSPDKDLYYEVILSPQEAQQGGLFPIRVPVIENCPQCDQTGFRNIFTCPECNGIGHRRSMRAFSLSIPPRTAHGTETMLSLEDIGLPEVRLFVCVQINPFID